MNDMPSRLERTLMEQHYNFLTTLRVEKDLISDKDYIKIVTSQKEFEHVLKLMKLVFPSYYSRYKKKRWAYFNPRCETKHYFLAYFNGFTHQILGSAYLTELEHYKIIGISTLQVHPDYRGRGIASSLLHVMKKIGLKTNFHFLYLEVEKRNLAAIKLYIKCKFRQLASVYRLKPLNSSNLKQIHTNIVDFKTMTLHDYIVQVKPFFSNHFPHYHEVFHLLPRMKHQIRNNAVFAWVKDGQCRSIVVKDKNKKQISIYLPNNCRYLPRLIVSLYKQSDLTLDNFPTILILGFLQDEDIKAFQDQGIYLYSDIAHYNFFYDLKDYKLT